MVDPDIDERVKRSELSLKVSMSMIAWLREIDSIRARRIHLPPSPEIPCARVGVLFVEVPRAGITEQKTKHRGCRCRGARARAHARMYPLQRPFSSQRNSQGFSAPANRDTWPSPFVSDCRARQANDVWDCRERERERKGWSGEGGKRLAPEEPL